MTFDKNSGAYLRKGRKTIEDLGESKLLEKLCICRVIVATFRAAVVWWSVVSITFFDCDVSINPKVILCVF